MGQAGTSPPLPPPPAFLQMGKIAVKKGFITSQQLNRALQLQNRSGEELRLGDILVRKGWMSVVQWEEVLKEYRKVLHAPSEHSGQPYEVSLLGRQALQRGLVTQAQLNECLRLQGIYEARGKIVRLGQLLVQKGYATPEQIRDLLKGQNKVQMSCTGCGRSYNIVRPEAGAIYKCPACNLNLMSPETMKGATAEGTWLANVVRMAHPSEEAPAAGAPVQRAVAAPPGRQYRSYARRRQVGDMRESHAGATMRAVVALFILVLVLAGLWVLAGDMFDSSPKPAAPEVSEEGENTDQGSDISLQEALLKEGWLELSRKRPRSGEDAQKHIARLREFAEESSHTKWSLLARARIEDLQKRFGLEEEDATAEGASSMNWEEEVDNILTVVLQLARLGDFDEARRRLAFARELAKKKQLGAGVLARIDETEVALARLAREAEQ